MTAEELKAKRLALEFGCRNALPKALGTTNTRRNTVNTTAGPRKRNWMKRVDAGIPGLVMRLREELELIQKQFAQEAVVALGAINQWE